MAAHSGFRPIAVRHVFGEQRIAAHRTRGPVESACEADGVISVPPMAKPRSYSVQLIDGSTYNHGYIGKP